MDFLSGLVQQILNIPIIKFVVDTAKVIINAATSQSGGVDQSGGNDDTPSLADAKRKAAERQAAIDAAKKDIRNSPKKPSAPIRPKLIGQTLMVATKPDAQKILTLLRTRPSDLEAAMRATNSLKGAVSLLLGKDVDLTESEIDTLVKSVEAENARKANYRPRKPTRDELIDAAAMGSWILPNRNITDKLAAQLAVWRKFFKSYEDSYADWQRDKAQTSWRAQENATMQRDKDRAIAYASHSKQELDFAVQQAEDDKNAMLSRLSALNGGYYNPAWDNMSPQALARLLGTTQQVANNVVARQRDNAQTSLRSQENNFLGKQAVANQKVNASKVSATLPPLDPYMSKLVAFLQKQAKTPSPQLMSPEDQAIWNSATPKQRAEALAMARQIAYNNAYNDYVKKISESLGIPPEKLQGMTVEQINNLYHFDFFLAAAYKQGKEFQDAYAANLRLPGELAGAMTFGWSIENQVNAGYYNFEMSATYGGDNGLAEYGTGLLTENYWWAESESMFSKFASPSTRSGPISNATFTFLKPDQDITELFRSSGYSNNLEGFEEFSRSQVWGLKISSLSGKPVTGQVEIGGVFDEGNQGLLEAKVGSNFGSLEIGFDYANIPAGSRITHVHPGDTIEFSDADIQLTFEKSFSEIRAVGNKYTLSWEQDWNSQYDLRFDNATTKKAFLSEVLQKTNEAQGILRSNIGQSASITQSIDFMNPDGKTITYTFTTSLISGK